MRVLVVTNMYPSKKRPASGTFVQQQVKGLIDIGLEVEVMLVDRENRGWLAYYGIATKIARRLATARFHLVHVMYGGVLARVVTTLANEIPVVVSLCGDDLLGTPGPRPVATVRSWLNKTASHKACRVADGIVVKSENLAKALPAVIDKSNVRIIPNGIDTDLFRPLDRTTCVKNLALVGDSFHIIFALNCQPAVKRLALAEESVRRARRLGIPAEFHALQGIPHAQMPVWLNAGDVLLLTSLHEGSPNIIKEALACNTPIVSVDVGDVVERIKGIQGCHIVQADPQAIALKLQEVAVCGLRIEGRSSVSHLSLREVAESLRSFYGQVVERRVSGENKICVE
jgi:teichuronic acid biosynthesis glycosyltransferase TuaC